MKKIKLHKWSAFFILSALIAAGCSKRTFPSNNSTDEKFETASGISSNNAYLPPQVITISDEKAKTNKEGELYYDDENGYRYWKYSDGKYYLDQKYENGTSPKKKALNRKKTRKSRAATNTGEYVSNR